jgi:DedD protein
MDQALKARLIGAVILVIVAVLVIPELLSGRKIDAESSREASRPGESRTITIELDAPAGRTTESPAPAASQPPQLPVPGASPAPSLAVATESRDAAAGRPSPSTAPVGRAAAVEERPATPASAEPVSRATPRGTWSVQVGAFGSTASAQKLAGELDGAGFAAYVATTTQGGKTLHRVRVGPVAERSEADRLAARLKTRKLPVAVVANE